MVFLKLILIAIVLILISTSILHIKTRKVFAEDMFSIFIVSFIITLAVYMSGSAGLLGDRLHYEFSSERYNEVYEQQLKDLLGNHSYKVDDEKLTFDNGAEVDVRTRYFTARVYYHPEKDTSYSFLYKGSYETTLRYVTIVRAGKAINHYL